MECQEWIRRSQALYSKSLKFHSRAGDQLQWLCFFLPSFSSVHAGKCWNNDFRYCTTAFYSVFSISSFKFSVILYYTLILFHIQTRSIGYTEKDDTRIASPLKHVRPTAVQHPSENPMKIILSFIFYATSRLQWTPHHKMYKYTDMPFSDTTLK
jgi:hypothetical protein